MKLIRASIFNILFYLNIAVHIVIGLPLFFLPRRFIWVMVRSWTASSLWLLRLICGIRYELIGLDRVPKGALLIASKHQSVWETFVLPTLFSDPTFVLKRELLWLPFFGWFLKKSQMIPVDRGKRSAALVAMTERAKEKIAEGRQIIIFPEGTRRAPGADPNYKFGVAHLYRELGVSCLPVALNTGCYWPRRSWEFRPGTIRVEFLPPIAPGLPAEEFLKVLQDRIETASNRLLALCETEPSRN